MLLTKLKTVGVYGISIKLVLTVRLTYRTIVVQNKSCTVNPTIFLICTTKITFILRLFNPVISKTFEKKLIIITLVQKLFSTICRTIKDIGLKIGLRYLLFVYLDRL